jgi:ankyrin repeat protein
VALREISDPKLVKVFLEHGADPNVALEWVASVDILQALLEAGADVRSPAAGEALRNAASSGRSEFVGRLLRVGVSVDATDEHGKTALMEAADSGYPETVDLLLRSGANVNAAADDGSTPLIAAASHVRLGPGRTEASRLLLSHGADVNAHDNDQRTALWYATRENASEMVSLLRAAGATR